MWKAQGRTGSFPKASERPPRGMFLKQSLLKRAEWKGARQQRKGLVCRQ